MGWLVVVFFALMIIGVPIAYSMGISGLAYMILQEIPFEIAAQRFFSQTQSFSFLAVPFFILAGNLMVQSGIANKIIKFADVLVRHFWGGLGCVSVITSMIMAGCSGSAVADASSVGSILIPAMNDKGYDKSFSATINATSSIVGIIIPPSSTMIIIAYLTNLSVGKMFAAGVIPGLLIGFSYLVITVVVSKKRNYPREKKATKAEFIAALKDGIWALLLPIFLIGSIVSGIATPTESASLSAVFALLIGLLIYKTLDFKKIRTALIDTVKGTSVIMMIVCCASIFSYVLIRENIPQMISEFILALNVSNFILLFVIVIILLIAGMFMDAIANLFIFIPILFPIINGMGVDPIQFSIVLLLTVAVGQFTPPVGTTLFISCKIGKISIEKTIKDLIPFFIVGVGVILLITYIPVFTLWLPSILF